MKFDLKTLLLVASTALNVLGGTGVVKPVVNGPAPCPVCAACR